ncbi:MAG: hypothetical protein RL757_2912 [Bacteroidota bacterium]|jgi:DNA polymerase-3 subunit gamma/tau
MSSNFVVSARKYRPTRFADVVGQSHVSQTLRHALQEGRVAHAFLFCGPRGVGKTTNARILAKILNCTDRQPDYEACTKCDSCRAFEQNASFNIVELDAASNNSVEHIRALVEQVRFAPQQGKYKVFIIDEVHMLSTAAFNAFLKTLEEPPSYAIFILATTERHKILPTILSRCQIFDFRRIQILDIVQHLQKICEAEAIEADADALHVIAQKADGALRDALSIFDRIVSASGKKIKYDDVIENLNILDYDYFFKMTDAMLAQDASQALLIFDDILKKGFDAELFINGLAEHLRNLLVAKDAHTLRLLETGDALRARYATQAMLAPIDFILTALNICNDCDLNFKMARNKRLHTEMSLIKMAYIGKAISLAKSGNTATDEKKNNSLETNVPAPKTPPPSIEAVVKPLLTPQTEEKESKNDAPPGPSLITHPEKMNVLSQMPRLGSLDNISKMLEEEERMMKEISKPLTLENVSECWKKYSETVESPSLKMNLLNAKLELDANKVVVRLGSELGLSFIQEESANLMNYLRFELNAPALTMEAIFDEALMTDEARLLQAQQQTRRMVTPREKLLLMMEINPLVKDFSIRFKLKPEDM